MSRPKKPTQPQTTGSLAEEVTIDESVDSTVEDTVADVAAAEDTAALAEQQDEKSDPVQEEEVKETPEPEPKPAEVAPVARVKGPKKGLVKSTLNVKANTYVEFNLEGIVKHKHNFNLSEAEGQLKEVIDFLNSYEERMSPTANIDEFVGESLQKQLFKNYLKILGLPNLERGVAMEVLLWKFFKNEKQTFRVNNLSRYTRNGKWNITELQMFAQLSNLFNLVKDPAERIGRIRSIKLGPTVDAFPNEKAKYTESLISWATSLK